MFSLLRITLFALTGTLLLAGCSREQESPPAAAVAAGSGESATGLQTESATAALRSFLAENYTQDMVRAPYTAS